jgi:NitT/TauT family transport system permease protein
MARVATSQRVARVAAPVLVGMAMLVLWQTLVSAFDVPKYIVPSPLDVATALGQDWALLSRSLLVTLKITLLAFACATVLGTLIAFVFAQSRWIEASFFPYAVLLQVTPIVAIAPLLLIYMPQQLAVLTCAWIVAFFPVLANTTLGLNSVDRNLADLFALYGASRGRVLWNLKLPSALPYILGGLRIAGGLSLIGAVVAEIAAGSAGAGSGLAYRIVESGYRLNIPRMFAALVLLSIAGIVIFYLLAFVNHIALRRWHESAVEAGN